MKKTKIEGTNAIVLRNLDKTIIRKKKIKGFCAYPRVVPENKTLTLLRDYKIKYPKLLKNKRNYVDLEYIEGSVVVDIDKNYLSNVICNYIYELSKVEIGKLKRYSKWKNNTSFLNYHIKNLLLVIRRSGYIKILKQIGIDFTNLLILKNIKMDDTRRQILIHGDLKRENFIYQNGQYILIDWELACCGDPAYDIALLFVGEDYTQEEMRVVKDRLCASLLLDPDTLEKDVDAYMRLEYYRRCVVGFIEAIDLNKKGLPNEYLLQRTYDYYSKISNSLSLEGIKNIINK